MWPWSKPETQPAVETAPKPRQLRAVGQPALSEEEREELRALAAEGMSPEELAARFEVSVKTVQRIIDAGARVNPADLERQVTEERAKLELEKIRRDREMLRPVDQVELQRAQSFLQLMGKRVVDGEKYQDILDEVRELRKQVKELQEERDELSNNLSQAEKGKEWWERMVEDFIQVVGPTVAAGIVSQYRASQGLQAAAQMGIPPELRQQMAPPAPVAQIEPAAPAPAPLPQPTAAAPKAEAAPQPLPGPGWEASLPEPNPMMIGAVMMGLRKMKPEAVATQLMNLAERQEEANQVVNLVLATPDEGIEALLGSWLEQPGWGEVAAWLLENREYLGKLVVELRRLDASYQEGTQQ